MHDNIPSTHYSFPCLRPYLSIYVHEHMFLSYASHLLSKVFENKAWSVWAHSLPKASKHRMPFLHIPTLPNLLKYQIFSQSVSQSFEIFVVFFCLFLFSCKTFCIYAFHHSLCFTVMSVLYMNMQTFLGKAIFYNFLCVPQYLSKDIVDSQ